MATHLEDFHPVLKKLGFQNAYGNVYSHPNGHNVELSEKRGQVKATLYGPSTGEKDKTFKSPEGLQNHMLSPAQIQQRKNAAKSRTRSPGGNIREYRKPGGSSGETSTVHRILGRHGNK